MRMDKNKIISSEAMEKVTGGVGTDLPKSAIGMENYPTEQKTCPKCGGSRLIYANFDMGNGTGKIGQSCECGHSWTFGNKTSIL